MLQILDCSHFALLLNVQVTRYHDVFAPDKLRPWNKITKDFGMKINGEDQR